MPDWAVRLTSRGILAQPAVKNSLCRSIFNKTVFIKIDRERQIAGSQAGLHACCQDSQIIFNPRLLACQRVFGNKGLPFVAWRLQRFRYLAHGQILHLAGPGPVPEPRYSARRAQIYVIHGDHGLRGLFRNIQALLESCHTANIRTIAEVIFIARAGTLHKSHLERRLAV